jgi:hypothetical protein
MEAAIAIVGTLVVAVIGWILYHNAQCSAFHERVAKIEERLGMKQ